MTYLYPRMARADVDGEVERLARTLQSGGRAHSFPDGGHHPRAVFPNDGVPVPPSRLKELHDTVVEALSSATAQRRSDRDRIFDTTVGNVLTTWFAREGRQHASHPDVWPYLTLVVLPDVAVKRFGPDRAGSLPSDRYRSGRRNVFHRLYLRSWILGDLLGDPDLPLFEDELVGLIDRNLSSDHRLARHVSREIMTLGQVPNRRNTVRAAFKALQFELRVTDLAAMHDHQLGELLSGLFRPEAD